MRRKLRFKYLVNKWLGTRDGRGNIRDLWPTDVVHGMHRLCEYLFRGDAKAETFSALLNVQGDKLIKLSSSFVGLKLCFEWVGFTLRYGTG
mmetsp:Transcript_11063/g.26155  ORF Transcript_11063/g.26155 Transcript_11063/m.26155 type:complete len:91 (-) Transcript_11063:371-643(-)